MADKARRLFAPQLPAAGEALDLPEGSLHHARVLRLAAGDRVQLFDGRLGEADARIEQITRDALRCVVDARRTLPAPAGALHVVLGLPKGGKLEDIARMLAELGAASLHLALCERSVPRPSDAAARMARLERIALEACAQSGQPLALALHAPAELSAAAARAPDAARRFVFWEEARTPLDDAWRAATAKGGECWAVIGPEGGLEAGEVQALEAIGYSAVGLGSAVLRVETAAPVIAGLLLDRMGRLRE